MVSMVYNYPGSSTFECGYINKKKATLKVIYIYNYPTPNTENHIQFKTLILY